MDGRCYQLSVESVCIVVRIWDMRLLMDVLLTRFMRLLMDVLLTRFIHHFWAMASYPGLMTCTLYIPRAHRAALDIHHVLPTYVCPYAYCYSSLWMWHFSLTDFTLGKPGLERFFKHPQAAAVLQMLFITNQVRFIYSQYFYQSVAYCTAGWCYCYFAVSMSDCVLV